MTSETYKIIDWRMGELTGLVADLGKKAKKLGIPAPTLRVVGHEKTFKKDKAGREVTFDWTLVELCSEPVKLAGWRFAAVISHATTGNTFRAIAGVAIPETFRFKAAWCDHCKKNRARIDTYVCSHEDGRMAQIGKNCLKDFLGHPNPQALAAYLEALQATCESAGGYDEDDAWGEYSGGGYRERGYPTLSLLAQVCAVCDKHGWVSRTKARESGDEFTGVDATVDIAARDLPVVLGYERAKKDKYGKDLTIRPTDAHAREAEAALAWARTQGENWVGKPGYPSPSEYRTNLYYACLRDMTDKDAGLVASLISVYRREQEKAREEKVSRETTVLSHIGTVGKREVFTLTIMGIRDIDSDYGCTHLHRMQDAAGNKAVWFSSTKRLAEGQTYILKGTVKEHGDYKGIPQTVITRCDVQKLIGEEAMVAEYLTLESEAHAIRTAVRAKGKELLAASKAAEARVQAFARNNSDGVSIGVGHLSERKRKEYCKAVTALIEADKAYNDYGYEGRNMENHARLQECQARMSELRDILGETPVAPEVAAEIVAVEAEIAAINAKYHEQAEAVRARKLEWSEQSPLLRAIDAECWEAKTAPNERLHELQTRAHGRY